MRQGALAVLILLFLPQVICSDVKIFLGWERPVRFQVVDAETGEPVPRPLVIIGTEKEYEGAPAKVRTFEVRRGSEAGFVEYTASERVPGVELRVTASGYSFLIKQVDWNQLPPRQLDKEGFDTGPPPIIVIELTNLERRGDWNHEFRLNIGPTLEEFLEMEPHAISREGRRLIADFLNRERDRLMGL